MTIICSDGLYFKSTPAKSTNSVINQGAGSTNHYVISVDGTTVKLYANGERLGTTDLKVSMADGQFGFVSWLDSGEVNCTYSNIWIWGLP